MSLRICRAAVPGSAQDPRAWALRSAVEVERAVQEDTWGYPDLAETVPGVWAWARNQEYGTRMRFVAVLDDPGEPAGGSRPRPPDEPGVVVGTASLELPESDNTHLAVAWVAVVPEHRRRGIGAALADHVEAQARAAGRRVIWSWTEHAAEAPPPQERTAGADDDAIVPPTGFGRLPRDHAARFAVARSYRLEQAERHSTLALPADPALLDRLGAQAAAAAGPDYRLVTWTGAAPPQWLDAYAVLQTRMSTDVPVAGLEYEEEVYDAARMRDFEREHHEAGHQLVVAAAEHRPTSVLAAYTVLVVREGEPSAVFQDSTLVLREHRGHRLGMLVKVANVRALERDFPWARRIHTYNAEENAHMLAINVALGFAPAGISGEWQKHLT